MNTKSEVRRVEAHLPKEQYDQFKLLAQAKQWSPKKLAENIITAWVAENKTNLQTKFS